LDTSINRTGYYLPNSAVILCLARLFISGKVRLLLIESERYGLLQVAVNGLVQQYDLRKIWEPKWAAALYSDQSIKHVCMNLGFHHWNVHTSFLASYLVPRSLIGNVFSWNKKLALKGTEYKFLNSCIHNSCNSKALRNKSCRDRGFMLDSSIWVARIQGDKFMKGV
jgi:hypothetical protein